MGEISFWKPTENPRQICPRVSLCFPQAPAAVAISSLQILLYDLSSKYQTLSTASSPSIPAKLQSPILQHNK